ncbi:discoidin domain-containing protein [Parabacteroides sp. FAFU027]|uniref:discoidin domain-containing protein n=1 Tax=Parabacteroides sp. FAFU027 TaxID=2922715 RepID=UPI00397990B7
MTFGSYKLTVQNITSATGYVVESGDSKTFAYSGITAVTASGYQSGTTNTPDKTVDFDFNTRWSCDGKGQWIMYDLGDTKLVTSADISFYSGNSRKSYFSINLSSNGTDFTEVYNGQSSGTTTSLENFDFTDQNARYVKIIGGGNNQSTWNSYTEVRINHGTAAGVNDLFNGGKNRLVIYPNPMVGHELTLVLKANETGSVTVQITDVAGKTLISKTRNIEENSIHLSDLNLPSGQYLIKVKANDIVQSGLLIVK